MLIIPAVDIFNGKCVRLIRGNPNDTIVYFNNPLDSVEYWEKEGAEYLHLIDLNAALKDGDNFEIVKKILKKTSLKVQVGGGVNSLRKAAKICDLGAERVIIGTLGIENPKLLRLAVNKLGSERVVAAIDHVEGKVAVDGWKRITEFDAIPLAQLMERIKVGAILFTSIARDGTLEGPDFESIEKLRLATKIPLIASGGIKTLEDVAKVAEIGVEGLVVGRALYEKRFSLREAQRCSRKG
jgi:phosphoribosylformimino-5-aminoimidazole carboxamide ribotide isomerase